ncbi:cell division protein ZapA [Allosphingosinicella humi]
MATVDIEIASRRYSVACRDGEQDHLQSVAAIVDRKAREVGQALGSLSEARQLLFASLLLADELKEQAAGGSPSPSLQPATDPLVASALERLADRVELLAEKLENQA